MKYAIIANQLAAKSRPRGFLNYFVAVLRTIIRCFRAPHMTIECDGVTISQPSILVSIMNGRRMGGGFLTAPQDSMTDGLLDLCIAKSVSRLTMIRMVPRILKGNQAGHPAVRFERTRRVKITGASATLPVHADGEIISPGCEWISIETLPGAVEDLVL